MAKVSLEIDVYKMTKQCLEHMLIEGYEVYVTEFMYVKRMEIEGISQLAIVVDVGMGKPSRVYSGNENAVKLFQAWEVVCRLC